jgi:quercetin dioxygenase-like cupin family protein
MLVVNSHGIKSIASPKGDPMVANGEIERFPLVDEATSGGFAVSIVKFAKGARLAFHTHVADQILYITEGKGILATKDKEHIVTPGMVVYIPAGEVHYHGATADSGMAHLTVYKGQSKVTG